MTVHSAAPSPDELTHEMLTQCAKHRVRRRWNPHLGRTGGWDIDSSAATDQIECRYDPHSRRVWALSILAATGLIVWVEAGEHHWYAEPTEYGREVLTHWDTPPLGDAA